MSRRISKTKLGRYNVVVCDHEHGKHSAHIRFPGEPRTCGDEFRSHASSDGVLNKQLAAAKWSSRDEDGEKKDFCEMHTEAMRRRMSASR